MAILDRNAPDAGDDNPMLNPVPQDHSYRNGSTTSFQAPEPQKMFPDWAGHLFSGTNIRFVLGILSVGGALYWFLPVSQAQLQNAQKDTKVQVEAVKSDALAKIAIQDQRIEQNQAAIGRLEATGYRTESKVDKLGDDLRTYFQGLSADSERKSKAVAPKKSKPKKDGILSLLR